MTHTIDSVHNWPSGDTRIFPFTVLDKDSDGEPLNITNADINWYLRDRVSSDKVLSLDSDGVSLEIVEPFKGEFEISVEKTATEDISGQFREVVILTDADNNRTRWSGTIRIEDIE